MNRLNSTKWVFIEEFVRNCIINGTDFTPQQYG
jgi:hypothetical protein